MHELPATPDSPEHVIVQTRRRYAVAASLVIAAALCHRVLAPVLQENAPFLTYFPAVMAASLVGGLGPGLVSLALSLVSVALLDGGTLATSDGARPSPATQALFALAALVIIWLGDRAHQLVIRLEREGDEARTARLPPMEEPERELRSEREPATPPAPAPELRPDDTGAAQLSKDAFLSVLSHELRSLLNAVLGWAEVLRMSTHDPEQVATAAEVIKRNARAQATLISSLLDANALASGRVQLDLRHVDVTESAQKAIEAFRPRADAARITLNASLPGTALVLADAARLDQVLGYLLEHALHATPAGGEIALSVSTLPGGDLEIAVTDTGPGIPAELLSSVFETFTNPAAARRATNQRLGLAITRYIAELHGGTASAMSEGVGKGSTINVRLPRAVSTPTPLVGDHAPGARGAAASPK